MRYLGVAVLCSIALIACQQPGGGKSNGSTGDSVYSLSGKIEGVDSGWVYLMNRQSSNENPDSTMVMNGVFTFTGKAATPQFCLLGITNNGNKEFRLGFFIDNSKMKISGKKDSLSEALVTGSPTQDEYKNFLAGRKPLDEEGEKLSQLYQVASEKKDKRLTDSLEKVFEVFEKKQKDFVQNYARQHPASYVAALEIYQNFSYNPELARLQSIYAGFDTTIQNSYYGNKIKMVLEIAKKTAIGNDAPAFVQNDPDGKPVSLSSFKGKYLLVDFWASWCGPCRGENPNVVIAYQKFHAKGFDILGVSLDDKKEDWMAAVTKDKLTWTQVSDLKGWKNSVAELYGVQAIPMNYLIDKNGKIIASGLRGNDLEDKLSELLK